LIVLFFCLVGLTAAAWYQVRDRHPGYSLRLEIPRHPRSAIQAGFAAQAITPDVPDQWNDANGDAAYHESDGDSFVDGNGNGTFDALWMAGFQNARPANAVHDDLWARAMVLDDEETRIALVALDVIGLFHDDVLDIREEISRHCRVDYTIVTSTHNHEAPDLLGLWGPSHFRSGVNPAFRDRVKEGAAAAVVEAVSKLRPARLRVVQDLDAARDLVTDTRPPEVYDPGLRLIQAIDPSTGATLGVLASWANHPETTWSKNLQITSDFPHFFREGIEKGVGPADNRLEEGLGGTVVYVNGAIGGLMTTSPSVPVVDPVTGTQYAEPSMEKAQAEGNQLALAALRMLRSNEVEVIGRGAIELQARTVMLPLSNPIFRLGVTLGIIDRGFSGWMQLRSEVAAWKLGPISFICVPGEIYPEIVEGGIEAPEGGDFEIEPVEVPPLRSLMPGKYRFVLGLANDEVGYIIPRSEWDEKPPYLYGAQKELYGEITSLGPDTAPLVHQKIRELVTRLTR